ncbi:MarR family transcriptional regulator [Bacillus sp. V3B]|uniref:MarR family winged helix-turn-helix transcriptional regulator n=1 Tax=Bacillus sp. V3B TaxID=2804915 RepID=UPI00210D8B91|nr:MarR family transcriptional regulator [Bacillus sp. V3B]MCQ6275598.1 MarR family transcriptional regulator [Bacillus sp. V3B]
MYNEFFHQYLQLSRSFTKKLNEHLAQLNIYHAQWSILYYLHQTGSATLVEISHYSDVEKPTITRTVNRLYERGLITQIPTKDKRERRIQLTDLGLQIYEDCQHVVNQFEQSIMSNIPKKDVEQTKQILLQLMKNIKGD